MAQPLLDFLEGRARAALPYFKRGVAMGLGANDIIIAVSERIGGIRRQTALDIIAALRGPIETERAFRLVGKTTPLPQDLHTTAPVNLSTNYQYVVGAYDELGEPLGHVTVSSNIPLAAVQIQTTAGLLFKDQAELYLEEGSLTFHSLAIEEANVSPSVPLE